MRADALQRRTRIIANARHLFAERGHGVALELIAEASDVGIATLYRNFPTREDLIRAVVVDIIESIEAAAQPAAATPDRDTWALFITQLAELDLGAFTGIDPETLDADVLAAQAKALATLNEALAAHRAAGVIHSDFDAVELIVTIGILTRPQPASIMALTPGIVARIVEGFIDWTLAG